MSYWIPDANLGCGRVPELESVVRISEEIDALQIMGLKPLPRLVTTAFAVTSRRAAAVHRVLRLDIRQFLVQTQISDTASVTPGG